MQLIKTAIVGASGYTGSELVRLLLQHPNVEITAVTSRQEVGRRIDDLFPRFRKLTGADLAFIAPDPTAIAKSGAQVAFLALPHGVAAEIATALLALNVKVIDLSADFRIHDAAFYEEFYHHTHPAHDLLKEAVYGLPEIHAEKIRQAKLIASPGCYPTSIILPLVPLLQNNLIDPKSIIANSLSGVSGAGKKPDASLLFCECNESLRAYGLPKHRHLAEIEQELSLAANQPVTITFIPHLVPVNTGIHTSITATLSENTTIKLINEAFEKQYVNASFVRLLGNGVYADTKNVTRSNYLDIGWHIDARTNRIIITSAEDNVIKGAGGQAIQSFNLLFKLDEKAGLQSL
jgi:N-acetyl-gamma-glutamyl-phosphate reductase